MGYLIVILGAYLIGSSNLAFYLSRMKKTDLAGAGTKNLGASNTALLMGWGAGILVGVHDVAKAALAVVLARMIFPSLPHIGAVAGVASVLGHIFPFYLKFQGGKGFAAYVGMSVALNWKLALALLVVYVIVVFLTDYMVMGTIMLVVTVPVFMGILDRNIIGTLILLIATVVILIKHWDNYIRLVERTELSLRSVIRGDPKGKSK